jgi:Domain of unknown function (DUF4389)
MSEPIQPTIDPAAPSASPDRARMGMRLLHLILVGLLIGAGVAVLHVMSIVQFIIMLVDKGQPNAQIAAFGKSLGLWLAKAVRFQTAQAEDKPWPWSPLD